MWHDSVDNEKKQLLFDLKASFREREKTCCRVKTNE